MRQRRGAVLWREPLKSRDVETVAVERFRHRLFEVGRARERQEGFRIKNAFCGEGSVSVERNIGVPLAPVIDQRIAGPVSKATRDSSSPIQVMFATPPMLTKAAGRSFTSSASAR